MSFHSNCNVFKDMAGHVPTRKMISRAQLEIYVCYSAPVFDSRRLLRVLPLRRENQTVRRERFQTFPQTDFTLEKADENNNRRLLLRHKRLGSEFRFALEVEIETNAAPIAEDKPDFARWKMPSRAVVFGPTLQILAKESRKLAPLSRATYFCELCFQSLEYNSQTNDKPRAAIAVWDSKIGNCADFAHVFLVLCRAAGLPARYVAGFGHAPGQLHAWAEVWCDGFWHPFDPTLGRAASLGNIAVALGRDFYDCSPHSGTFRGVAEAHLELHCETRCL
jgi:transglutaminase-like putative cysteine protease